MRRKETQSISDILAEFSRDKKFDTKLMETRLIDNWGQMLGPVIDNATQKVYISNRVLFVHIESAVVKNELFMMRSQIVDALNKSVGAKVIDSITFR